MGCHGQGDRATFALLRNIAMEQKERCHRNHVTLSEAKGLGRDASLTLGMTCATAFLLR
jgi:hypothetical protein